jgi:hypothetical protein
MMTVRSQILSRSLDPGLVDEDQTLRRDAVLILASLRTSGRSRSLTTTVFLKPRGVDEGPDRPIIGLEAVLGEFGDKPAQGKVLCLHALRQPRAGPKWPSARACPSARRNAADLTERRAQTITVRQRL